MFMNIYVERGEGGAPLTTHLWDDVDGYLKFTYAEFAYAYRRNEGGEKVSLYGHNVTKIFSWAKNDTTVMESDVPPETRVLTDTYLESDEVSTGHRILFFDIEVDSKNGYPRVETASNELYSIAMYDTVTQEYTILAVNNPTRQTVNIPEATVIMFDSEEEMLTKFLDVYETIAPTIISGWNSDGFDVPYLYERLKKVFGKHEANRLSPIGIVKYSRSKETYQIAGVSSLDYRWLYKKFTYTEMPNYRLDTIGREELGISKVEYDSTLDVLYETDLEKFLKYNMRDVEILVKLNEKLKLIALVQSICHIGHVPYEDYWYSSRYIDGAILTYLHRKGIIAPNKPEGGDEKYRELKESDEEGFVGAFVKEVTPGLHSWVYSLDLQSLYPSIIMSLNVSPEAKIGKISNWNMEKHVRKQINEYILTDLAGDDSEKMSPADFAEFMKEGEFSISSNGVLYRTDKQGVVPAILEKWFAERLEYQRLLKESKAAGNTEKAEFYEKRQHVQKILLNSVYGYLGLPTARFYDLDNAAAVTTSGQDVVKTTSKFVNKMYVKKLNELNADADKDVDYVIYNDTDSCYLSTEVFHPYLDIDKDDASLKQFTIDWATEVETAVNGFYDAMASNLFFCNKHRFFIKGESVARSAFWLEKKRYAYHKIYDLDKKKDTDSITVKGLDVVRSSFPVAFRKFMLEIVTDILNFAEKSVIDKKLLDFKAQLADIPVEDIAKATSVKELSDYDDKSVSLSVFPKGTPAHVKAAIVYNRLLKKYKMKSIAPIRNGDKILWIYVKSNPLGLDQIAIKGFEDPPEILAFVKEYIDLEHHFEAEFRKKIQKFYDALDWNLISTSVNQNSGRFFG